MDDRAEMDATFSAMATMGISDEGRGDIVALTAGTFGECVLPRQIVLDWALHMIHQSYIPDIPILIIKKETKVNRTFYNLFAR